MSNKKKYLNDINLQITMSEYNENINLRKEHWTENGTFVGYVSKIYDNENGHGEQIYVIVPNKEDLAHPEQAEKITVLMRGSTGPDQYDIKGLLKDTTNLPLPTGLSPEQEAINTDVWADWVENDLQMGWRIIDEKLNHVPSIIASGVTSDLGYIGKSLWNKDKTHLSPQLIESSHVLQEILGDYKNARLKIYGHSLGIMDAQAALADLTVEQLERLDSVWLYNGPNIASQLDKEQLEKLLPHKSKINFYIDPRDIVGLDFEKGTLGAIGMVHFVASKAVGFSDQHMTYGYVLDENGNIKLTPTASTLPVNNALKMRVSFDKLKSQWSGGGLSSGEEQFLDVAQSYVIGKSMADTARVGLDELTGLKTRADSEVEALWSKVDFSAYSELSAWEVRDIFASHGVTHQQIVSDFHEYTGKKVKKMEKLSTTFSTLKTKLDEAVESKKALDGTLAGEFRTWHESL